MSRFDQLIANYFSDPQDIALAQLFVQRFENNPLGDRIVSTLLPEAARINQQISDGQLGQQQGLDYLTSFASEGAALPAHAVSEIRDWYQSVPQVSAEDEPEEDEPEVSLSYEISEAHQRTIDRLFIPADRSAAHAIALACDRDPQTAGRTQALLVELSKSTDMTPEGSYAFISSWLENTGFPPGTAGQILNAIPAAEHAQALAAKDAEIRDAMWPPEARYGAEEDDRANAREEMAKREAAMRAPAGSPEYNAYWHGGGAAAYRAAAERSMVEPPQIAVAPGPTVAPSAAPSQSMAVGWKSVVVSPHPENAPAAPDTGVQKAGV